MGLIAALFLISMGLLAGPRVVREKLPKGALEVLQAGQSGVGAGALLLGGVGVLYGLLRLLGALGTAFDGAALLYRLSYLAGAIVQILLGIHYGAPALRPHINNSRKEAALVAVADLIGTRRLGLGKAALALGGWLLVAVFLF